jgi:hypothetical protein
MYLTNRAKDGIPVWPAEICWRPETSDCISVGICIVDHNVGCIIRLDLGCKILEQKSATVRSSSDIETYCMNLNMIVHILGFNSEQE